MAGPTPVSALIHAATMVTAGIFMITRLNYLFDLAPDVQNIIAIVEPLLLLSLPLSHWFKLIKKYLPTLPFSIGIDVLSFRFGAYEVAVFHVIISLKPVCSVLFCIHALHGEQDMRKMGGLKSNDNHIYNLL
jgi:NADH-quinone oxidoreductase subunit L